MKTLLTVVIIAFFLNVSAMESVPTYRIISDTISADVPIGKCRIFGKITFEEQPIKFGKVSTVDHQSFGVSDSVGTYSFLIDAKTTKLYAFQIGYKEVVTDNHNFKSGHAMQIEFYLNEQGDMMIEEKPVIYLYSENGIKANVKLDLKGELTFSYPEYKNGWNVIVNSSSNIVDAVSGKSYPYLFWEGQKEGIGYTSPFNAFDGYQINTDSTISFLEAQLSGYGLNEKEQTDFITYWAPRITHTQFATIQFLIDEDYSLEIGELNVTPKPDHIRRVYLLFSGLDEPIESLNSIPENVKVFKRSGFTVIEWGGTEINLKIETSKL